MFFHQHPGLFHGPGGSPNAWLSFTNQKMGAIASSLKIDLGTIITVQEVMTIRKLNWQALGQKATTHILGPRLFALADSVVTARWAYQYYLSITMNDYSVHFASKGVKGAAARQGVTRALAQARVVGYSPIVSAPAKTAAQATIRRQLIRRGATKLGLRALPVIGWGLLAYDVYTVSTRGELWGVKVYEEEDIIRYTTYEG